MPSASIAGVWCSGDLPALGRDRLTDLLLIIVSAALVNNFVLVQFLGLCPFMGVSNRIDSALGMSLATTFVLTLSSVVAYLL